MTREQQRENQENARQAQPQQLGARQEPRYPEQAQPTPQADPSAHEAQLQDAAQSGTRKQAQERDVVEQRQSGQGLRSEQAAAQQERREPQQGERQPDSQQQQAQQERNPQQQAQQEEREHREQNGERAPGE